MTDVERKTEAVKEAENKEQSCQNWHCDSNKNATVKCIGCSEFFCETCANEWQHARVHCHDCGKFCPDKSCDLCVECGSCDPDRLDECFHCTAFLCGPTSVPEGGGDGCGTQCIGCGSEQNRNSCSKCAAEWKHANEHCDDCTKKCDDNPCEFA